MAVIRVSVQVLGCRASRCHLSFSGGVVLESGRGLLVHSTKDACRHLGALSGQVQSVRATGQPIQGLELARGGATAHTKAQCRNRGSQAS